MEEPGGLRGGNGGLQQPVRVLAPAPPAPDPAGPASLPSARIEPPDLLEKAVEGAARLTR